MIDPDFLQDLWDRPSEELREIMAHCVAIHTHRDGGPENVTSALLRIVGALRFSIERNRA